MTRFRRLTLLMCLALVAGGCSIFGGGKDTEEPPAELTPIETTVKVERLWSTRVGKGAERMHLGLRLATDGARVFAAAPDGTVTAVDAVSGKPVWSVQTELALAAGPSFGEGLLALGTSEGEVVCLDGADGAVLWRANVSGEVLAAPAISQSTVAVRSTDGRLYGLAIEDGSERWVVDRTVPRLTLRGVARPAIAGGNAVFGLDDGQILAIGLADGALGWESAIAAPRGRTELERLSDVDSAITVAGPDIFVAGYQSRAALLSADTGQVVWAQDLSTYRDIGIDWGQIYIADAGGSVLALDRQTGGPVWQQDALARRRLSGPTAYGTSVVVGDFEGYLHWLATRDGAFQARVRAGDTAIAASPLVIGENLYVLTDGGVIGAYRAAAGG